MAQDIRKMLKEHTSESPELSTGHEARFETKLAKAFPKDKPNQTFFWLKIAAVGILLLSISYFGYQQMSNNKVETLVADTSEETEKNADQFTLGDISPDLKNVEDFYLNGINVELASLEITDENKELMDGFMLRLDELNTEYSILTKEMNERGPSEETVTALINNLKLRLELLFKLKNKLKELKNIDNETFTSIES